MSGGFGGMPPGPGNPGPGIQTPINLSQVAQTFQNLVVSVNAILTQLKTGIALVAQVPTYTFAALPAAATHPALVVFCSNARKPGEGPGAGTGMLAFSDGAGWYSTAGTALAI